MEHREITAEEQNDNKRALGREGAALAKLRVERSPSEVADQVGPREPAG